MTMGVVKTTGWSLSLHQSGGGDASDDILAPWRVLVPPSWRSPWVAQVAFPQSVDCGLARDRLLERSKFSYGCKVLMSTVQHFFKINVWNLVPT